MSFLPINEENKDAPTGQTTNAPGSDTPMPPQTGGSVGDEGGGPATAAKGSATASPTQFGSSASKLGDYLSANAPQITQQADTLSGNLNTQYGNLNQGITDAANQFQQQVQGGYNANNPDVVTQAMADPTKFASDPNNVAAFQGQYNNAYTGPTNFEGTQGYSDLQNQVGQAVQQGNLLGTQSGLQSYLQGQGKNPTQAMSTLDSLLLRGNPEAQQKINTAAGQFGNLTGQLGTATTGADQSVVDAQKAAADSAAYAQGQINPYAAQFRQGLVDNLTKNESDRTAYNAAVNKNQPLAQTYQAQLLDAQNQDLAKSQRGLQAGFVDTFNIAPYKSQIDAQLNPSSQLSGLAPYLQNNSIVDPATLANLSTTDQYGKDAALQKLIGGGYQPVLDQAFISQAGTAKSIPGMPGAITDPAGQIQYMGDLTNMYSNVNLNPVRSIGQPGLGGSDPFLSMTPQQIAQQTLSRYNTSPTGYNNNEGTFGGTGSPAATAYLAALNRLIANQYAGRT